MGGGLRGSEFPHAPVSRPSGLDRSAAGEFTAARAGLSRAHHARHGRSAPAAARVACCHPPHSTAPVSHAQTHTRRLFPSHAAAVMSRAHGPRFLLGDLTPHVSPCRGRSRAPSVTRPCGSLRVGRRDADCGGVRFFPLMRDGPHAGARPVRWWMDRRARARGGFGRGRGSG